MAKRPNYRSDEWNYQAGSTALVCVVEYHREGKTWIRTGFHVKAMIGLNEIDRVKVTPATAVGLNNAIVRGNFNHWTEDEIAEWMESAIKRLQKRLGQAMLDLLNIKL